jgi:hypothetical protein
MNIENAPWLFSLALFYVFVIIALLSVEIVKKTLIPQNWKIRTVLLGLMPLFITLIITVISMAGEMLYLLPEYASGQQKIMQFVDTAYSYNNNLLMMIPMGLFYLIVLGISQNKKFQFWGNQSGHSKFKINVSGDSIRAANSNYVLQQQGMDLEQESEEDKLKDEEWRDACAIDDNYWNNWSNP